MYSSLCQDPLCPLSHPSIPPLVLSPVLNYNNVVVHTTRKNYMVRLLGQISEQSEISWDMNLKSNDSVNPL